MLVILFYFYHYEYLSLLEKYLKLFETCIKQLLYNLIQKNR